DQDRDVGRRQAVAALSAGRDRCRAFRLNARLPPSSTAGDDGGFALNGPLPPPGLFLAQRPDGRTPATDAEPLVVAAHRPDQPFRRRRRAVPAAAARRLLLPPRRPSRAGAP